MYQLKYKNYILYDPRLADEKLIVRDPSVKLAVSKAGEMSFTVDAEHPYLSNLRRMSALVELLVGLNRAAADRAERCAVGKDRHVCARAARGGAVGLQDAAEHHALTVR